MSQDKKSKSLYGPGFRSDPNLHRPQKRPTQSADRSTATVDGVNQSFWYLVSLENIKDGAVRAVVTRLMMLLYSRGISFRAKPNPLLLDTHSILEVAPPSQKTGSQINE